MADDVLDIWVNLVDDRRARRSSSGRSSTPTSPGYLGGDGAKGVGVDELLGRMDRAGVATGVLTPGPRRRRRRRGARGGRRPSRAGSWSRARWPTRPSRRATCCASARLAQHPRFSMVRITPAVHPGRHRRRQALPDLPGVRGARAPRRHQRRHPRPEGALAGAAPRAARGRDDRLPRPRRSSAPTWAIPTRSCSINYMRKWENLYLSCTAYAPAYLDPALLRYMALVGRPGSRAVGQRRPVVPDAALDRRGPGPRPRRRGHGPVPRRHRAPPARPHGELTDGLARLVRAEAG